MKTEQILVFKSNPLKYIQERSIFRRIKSEFQIIEEESSKQIVYLHRPVQ